MDTAQITNNAVGNAQLGGGAVSTGKIQPLAVDTAQLALGAVGTSQLQNGAVDYNKLAANSVDSTKIVNGSVSPADLEGGGITGATIQNASVGVNDFAAPNMTGVPLAGEVNVNPGILNAGECLVELVTVAGVKDGDRMILNVTDAAMEPELDASAMTSDTDGQLRIRICNRGGAAVNGAERSYSYIALR